MTSPPGKSVEKPPPAAVALLRTWDLTERLDPTELELRQMVELGQLRDHACATVPFYADRRGIYSADPLTPAIWQDLPILTRSDIQAAGPTLNTAALPADHGDSGEVVTSGSTGQPVCILTTSLASLYWMAITLRDHEWHQRDLTGRLAAIRADLHAAIPEQGQVNPNWGVATAGVYETGPCGLLSIRLDVGTQARWLVGQNPDYLLSYPSNLAALAGHFLAEGVRLDRLRQVRSYGEAIGPDFRDLCREAWGVEVVDMYSTRDAGYLALQCPASTSYHVQSEAVYLEVLNDEGRPCRRGETGRVVVTPLQNYATPLLRYEIGDLAEVGGPCGCGRRLPTLARIHGRVRNMWALPDGRRLWPQFSSYDWRHIEVMRQLQVVQHDLGHLEARVVGPRPLNTAEATEVEVALRRAMAQQSYDHPFRLTFTYLDHIDRTGSGKFEDFVSHA